MILPAGGTIWQIKPVINTMRRLADIEQRNRTLIAFTLLTGTRDSAIVSIGWKLHQPECMRS
jgi:hypothetical protein